MKMSRRDLLKLSAVQAVTFAIATNAMAGSEDVLNLTSSKLQTGLSIYQGATDENKTQFSIMIDSKIPFEVFVTDETEKIWKVDTVETITSPGHHKKIIKAFFTDLDSDGVYFLNVTHLETNTRLDRREFKMLKADRNDLRFALCSCMDDRHHKPAIWQNIVSKKPDVIFFLGDFVYVDSGRDDVNPARMWKRFCEARQTLEIFFSPVLIPTLATWDDHDFGLNNSTSVDFPYVKQSQKNFLSFFGQEEEYCRYLKRGPGVSSALKINSQLFILLDDRSYRKERDSEDRHAQWGKEQEEWMLDLIAQNDGPSWVMNGSQYFPQKRRKETVSGDVHFSEVSNIEKELLGYGTYEITSSSIHSINFPSSPFFYPNVRRMVGTGERNYVLVNAEAQGLGAKMQVTSYDPHGKNLFRLNLTV